MRVTFTFDLTAPTQDITSLIDGITWIDGEVLVGSVSDGTGTGVNQVAYRYWQTGSSGAGSGDQTVAISQTGTFSQTLGEIKSLAAGVYDFSVTSSDRAGNQQSQTFRFLKSDDRPITDQDLYVLGAGELASQDGGTGANAPAGPTGNLGYFGPTSGGGYGWGNYSTGSNSASNWQPSGFSDFPSGTNLPYIGAGYDLEYTDAVKKIVDYGTGAISKHPLTVNKKAALQNRQEVLNAIAERLNTISKKDRDSLNDLAFFNQMQGVMENLFATAYNPDDGGINSRLSGLRESTAGGAGYVLAQDLVKDSTAVSVQVFQATLLAAFNEVLYGNPISATPEAHSALLKAALELGQTYAKLAPSRETGTVLASDANFGFLDMLWRAQQPGTSGRLPDKDVIKAQLKNGVEALGQSLNGITDPIATLKFLNNLLNAAANSISLNEVRVASNGGVLDLRGDAHSAGFIRELVAFGFEVAKVNPTITTTGEAVISEFLNTLLRGGDERQAQGGLNQFFEGMNGTSDRVDGLEFGKLLIKSTQRLQDPEMQTQKKDAKFLSRLLNSAKLGSGEIISQVINDDTTAIDPGQIRSLVEIMNEQRRNRDAYGRLTPSEIKYAKRIFGNSIDYSQVRIAKDKWTENSVVTLGNTINYSSTFGRTAMFQSDGRTLTATGRSILIHELTHIWQYQNGGWAYAVSSVWVQSVSIVTQGNSNGAYNWRNLFDSRGELTKPWEQWNPEQQAQAIADYNDALESGTRNKRFSDAEVQTIGRAQIAVEKVRARVGAIKFP